eukprot:COSAG02_NODE_44585_length_365_cov_0.484962_1_plen_91_part_10
MTDWEIDIGLFEGTKTSNKYVALTLVGLDLLALIRLQGTTYEFIHVRGHTKDKGNDAADTNADKGNLSFFKQKTAYAMESRDWSSDVCSSD